MKLRTSFVSNSSSSSSTISESKMDDKSYCPYCFSNKEIYSLSDGGYKCAECHNYFDEPLSLTDIRKLKLTELDGQ